LTDGSGKKLHVKLNKNVDSLMTHTTKSYKYKERNGNIYVNGRELCKSDGKTFLTYEDSTGAKHDLVLVNSLDSIQELMNSGEFNVISYNYTESNLKYLSKFSNVEIDSIDELKMLENKRIRQIITQLSIDKFNAFEDSLKLVAVRIPCQSQQSFAPMEIIA
jgi:hypothetical protein